MSLVFRHAFTAPGWDFASARAVIVERSQLRLGHCPNPFEDHQLKDLTAYRSRRTEHKRYVLLSGYKVCCL